MTRLNLYSNVFESSSYETYVFTFEGYVTFYSYILLVAFLSLLEGEIVAFYWWQFLSTLNLISTSGIQETFIVHVQWGNTKNHGTVDSSVALKMQVCSNILDISVTDLSIMWTSCLLVCYFLMRNKIKRKLSPEDVGCVGIHRIQIHIQLR